MAESLSGTSELAGVSVRISADTSGLVSGVAETKRLITDLDQTAGQVRIATDNSGLRTSMQEAVTITETTVGKMSAVVNEARLSPTIDLQESKVIAQTQELMQKVTGTVRDSSGRAFDPIGPRSSSGNFKSGDDEDEGGDFGLGRLGKPGRFGRMFGGGFIGMELLRGAQKFQKSNDEQVLAGNDQEKQFKVDQMRIENIESMPIFGSIASLVANTISGAGLEAQATMADAKATDDTTKAIKEYGDFSNKLKREADESNLHGEALKDAKRDDKTQDQIDKVAAERNKRSEAINKQQAADDVATNAKFDSQLREAHGGALAQSYRALIDPLGAAKNLSGYSGTVDAIEAQRAKELEANRKTAADARAKDDAQRDENLKNLGTTSFNERAHEAVGDVMKRIHEGATVAAAAVKGFNAGQKQTEAEEKKKNAEENRAREHNEKFVDGITSGLGKWLTHEGKVGAQTSRALLRDQADERRLVADQEEADMVGAGQGKRSTYHAKEQSLLEKLRNAPADHREAARNLVLKELDNLKIQAGDEGAARLSSSTVAADQFFKASGIRASEKNGIKGDIDKAEADARGFGATAPDSASGKESAKGIADILAWLKGVTGVTSTTS